MNSGRKPATSRAFSRRFTAGTPAEKVEFLRARLESLLKGLRLFAGYCDLAPSPYRSEIKQFVDLAEIELDEGLRALQVTSKDSTAPSLLSDQSNTSSEIDLSIAKSGTADTDSSQESEKANHSSDSSPSFNNANLNPPGMSFDSMAQMAEVPEANDLEAILARLQSYGEALDNGEIEGRNVGTQTGRDARELLLGFEVCRMDSTPSDASPEQAAESQTGDANGDWSSTSAFAASSDATSITTQYTEVAKLEPDSSTAISSNSLTPGEYNNSAADSANAGAGSAADEDPASQTPPGENDSQNGKPGTGSGANSNPNSSRESKREQSENSNPVNSISPDNLLEINALKEELSAMLSQYKSPGAPSSNT